MDQKMMKIITIILGALLIVALLLVVTSLSKYGSLEAEYKKSEESRKILSSEKDSLAKKNLELSVEIEKSKEYRNRYEDVKAELEKANFARDDLQKKIDKVIEDREKLSDKLEKALTVNAVASVQANQADGEARGAAAIKPDEYWAGVLKDKANLEIESANLKDTIKNAQIKAEEYLRDKTALEIDLQRAIKEKEELQSNLEYNEKTGDNLSMQLYREKEDKRRLKSQADMLKQENFDLRSRLKDAMNSKVTLEKKLKMVDGKRVELYNRLNQMDQILQDKMSSIYDTKNALSEIKKSSSGSSSSIELSPIVVRSQDTGAGGGLPVEGLEVPANFRASAGGNGTNDLGALNASGVSNVVLGKIINTDSKNNFVIIDAGDNQSIYVGMMLRVFRGDNQIATLKAVEVKARHCAADIKEKTVNLKVGDIVR